MAGPKIKTVKRPPAPTLFPEAPSMIVGACHDIVAPARPWGKSASSNSRVPCEPGPVKTWQRLLVAPI